MLLNLIRKTVLATSLTVFTASAFADVVVIVHPSNASDLSAKQVQRIFLGKEKKFGNGTAVKPINQANNASRNDFDSNRAASEHTFYPDTKSCFSMHYQ